MASPLPMKRPVPMAPPSPIMTIWPLLKPRCNPPSRSAIEGRTRGASVVIVDAGIVTGADDADHVDSPRGRRLQRMELLARQKNHISRPHPRFAVLGPHVSLTG